MTQTTATNQKKLTLVCFSGDFDRAVAAFTMATGAAAMNYKVTIFFTFWGLNIVKKRQGRSFIGRGVMARFFNFLLGGRKNLPLSRLNFGGLSPVLMTSMMKGRGVATLFELIEAAKELGVEMTACEMSLHILGMTQEDLIDEITGVVGVPTFLNTQEGGNTLFI